MAGALSGKLLARFAEIFEGEEWLQKSAYLEDTFHHMGQGKKSLQSLRKNALTSSVRFLGKITLGEDCLTCLLWCLGLRERKASGVQGLSSTT